jgi:hypothetical protein
LPARLRDSHEQAAKPHAVFAACAYEGSAMSARKPLGYQILGTLALLTTLVIWQFGFPDASSAAACCHYRHSDAVFGALGVAIAEGRIHFFENPRATLHARFILGNQG